MNPTNQPSNQPTKTRNMLQLKDKYAYNICLYNFIIV